MWISRNSGRSRDGKAFTVPIDQVNRPRQTACRGDQSIELLTIQERVEARGFRKIAALIEGIEVLFALQIAFSF